VFLAGEQTSVKWHGAVESGLGAAEKLWMTNHFMGFWMTWHRSCPDLLVGKNSPILRRGEGYLASFIIRAPLVLKVLRPWRARLFSGALQLNFHRLVPICPIVGYQRSARRL